MDKIVSGALQIRTAFQAKCSFIGQMQPSCSALDLLAKALALKYSGARDKVSTLPVI